MELNESRSCSIKARLRRNPTGIHLKAGAHYHFRAVGRWVDWYVDCDADGYKSRNFLQRLCESFRRMPNECWFTLVGSLGGADEDHFRIGTSSDYSPSRSGELFCFANDLSLFYWNNKGEIELIVTRIG